MIEPIAKPRRKNPLLRTRLPTCRGTSAARIRVIIGTPCQGTSPWECGREGNSRCHRTFTAAAASGSPMTGAGRQGISSPHSGVSSPRGREATFPATGGSLSGSRDPWLLVSVNVLTRRIGSQLAERSPIYRARDSAGMQVVVSATTQLCSR